MARLQRTLRFIMKKYLLYPLVFCFVIILAACSQAVPSVHTETKTLFSSTRLSSPTKIIINSNTETPSVMPSFPAEPTISPQPIPTPTKILRPTLSPDQAQALALKMIKTNGDCLLPCWLGIEPGKTTWDEAFDNLNTFADHISTLTSDVYGIIFKFPQNTYRVDKTGATVFVRNGIVDQIMTPEDISLSELLSKYGSPTEIRIRAIGYNTMDPIGRFTLVLFYNDKGIMAVYDGTNEKSQIIHICPKHILGPQQVWLLWAPADILTFSDAGRQTLLISDYPPPAEEDYITLEQLTDLSIEAFTQRYKDPKNQSVCIEIHAPDWPND
jgi:hypothetical protein